MASILAGSDSIGGDVSVSAMTMTAPSGGKNSTVELDYLKNHLETMRFIVQKILIPAVVAFGVTGNLVNIAVLTRRWMKSSTNSYLTALAIYDMLYLVLALTLTLVHYESVKTSSWYQRYDKPFGRPLTDTASNTGVWLTLTFTVERYIGVCHPMKGKIWCTPKRAQTIVVVVCMAAACITLPEFFECRVVEMVDVPANDSSTSPPMTTTTTTTTTKVKVETTEFGQSVFYSRIYKYANQAMFTFVPLALLLVFNTLLIHAVLTAARRRQQMAKTGRDVTAAAERQDRQRRGQQRITVMLISVVIVFLLCQLPQALQGLYIVYGQVSNTLDDKKKSILKITGNVFNLLVVLNCSVNFVLYSSFSSKFRMTFRRLFCRYRLCSMCGPCSRADRTHLDDDGIEMSCSRGGVDGRQLIQRNANATNNLTASPKYHQQVAVLVTTSDGNSGRKLGLAGRIRRSLTRDRKQSSPILIMTPTTSRYGVTSVSRRQSGSSMSEAAALMSSSGVDSGPGGVGTKSNALTYATML